MASLSSGETGSEETETALTMGVSMGRLRSRFVEESEFVSEMEEELNNLITGDPNRATSLERASVAYDEALKVLEEYANNSENREELLELLARRQPSRETYAETVESRVILSGPGIPSNAPPDTWHMYSGSKMTPDYAFIREPAWDHDDCAEYCLASTRAPSFTKALVTWLTHQATVREIPEAKTAIVKAFQPLVRKLVGTYRHAGTKEVGPGYRKQAITYLSSELERMVEGFDFFYKKWHKAGPQVWHASDVPFRESGHVTSDFELPIGNFLMQKLDESIRLLVGLPGRGYSRQHVRGPFRVKREPLPKEMTDLEIVLQEDVSAILGVKATQVHRRIAQGHLRAWKTVEFRMRVGLSQAEELVLVNRAGEELSLTSRKYWIIDLDSVTEFLEKRDANGMLVATRKGRPRKRSQ